MWKVSLRSVEKRQSLREWKLTATTGTTLVALWDPIPGPITHWDNSYMRHSTIKQWLARDRTVAVWFLARRRRYSAWHGDLYFYADLLKLLVLTGRIGTGYRTTAPPCVLLISAPSLGVYYFCRWLCLSVCLSQTLLLLFFVSPWNRAISWPSVLHDKNYKTLFFDFWFRPPSAQNLLPKICTK